MTSKNAKSGFCRTIKSETSSILIYHTLHYGKRFVMLLRQGLYFVRTTFVSPFHCYIYSISISLYKPQRLMILIRNITGRKIVTNIHNRHRDTYIHGSYSIFEVNVPLYILEKGKFPSICSEVFEQNMFLCNTRGVSCLFENAISHLFFVIFPWVSLISSNTQLSRKQYLIFIFWFETVSEDE